MPQLMPFVWINSVFMIFMVMFTFIVFYNLKMMENMYEMNNYSSFMMKFNLMW